MEKLSRIKPVLKAIVIIAVAIWLISSVVEADPVEEEIVLSPEEEAVAEYWEARYRIPKGIMQPVESSALSEIGYDAEEHVLVVRFKSSGRAYAYTDFPIDAWESFKSARSIGSYYNRNIKGKYNSYAIAGQ